MKDAPIEVLTPSLKITRPQIYYGETSHEPVFVRTAQPEFNYPSGSSEVDNPLRRPRRIPDVGARACAPSPRYREGDWNILLTNALTPESRMMIRRRVPERLQRAGRIHHLGHAIRTW